MRMRDRRTVKKSDRSAMMAITKSIPLVIDGKSAAEVVPA